LLCKNSFTYFKAKMPFFRRFFGGLKYFHDQKLTSGASRGIHSGNVARVGRQLDRDLAPPAGPQRVGQPPALLLLRQALLGHHAEDAEEVVRLALHHEDGNGQVHFNVSSYTLAGFDLAT
jgi:hypothetical protein